MSSVGVYSTVRRRGVAIECGECAKLVKGKSETREVWEVWGVWDGRWSRYVQPKYT